MARAKAPSSKTPKRWSRRYRTLWVVVDGRGTAYLVSARTHRARSIKGFLEDADKAKKGWPWWRRIGYSCQRCDIKVRSSALISRPDVLVGGHE